MPEERPSLEAEIDDDEAWRLARLLDETGPAPSGTDEVFDPAPDKTRAAGADDGAPDASGSDEDDTPPKDGRPQT